MAEMITETIELEPIELKELMQFYGLDDSEIGYCGFEDPKINSFFVDLMDNICVHASSSNMFTRMKMSEEIASFYKFLIDCDGSNLRIQGEITNHESDKPKGSWNEITITDKDLINNIKSLVLSRIKSGRYFICDTESLNKSISWIRQFNGNTTRNGEMGYIAWQILFVANYWVNDVFEKDWNKTKLYSFVYDVMRLCKRTGKKCIVEKGYSGGIGSDKHKEMSNWIRAYEVVFPKLRSFKK